MNYLGDFNPYSTVYCWFSTYGSLGQSITISGLSVSDIKVYKDGSPTQRASTSGYALLDTDGIDFDGITGVHGFSVDTSDNSDAGFYASGHQYVAIVDAVTCDLQTISLIAGTFSIGRYGVVQTGDAYAVVNNVTFGNSALGTLIGDVPTAIENADALLKRDWTSVTGEAGRSVLNALRFLRNKWSVSGTTLTVTKEDDNSSAWTGELTTSSSIDPIIGVDPS